MQTFKPVVEILEDRLTPYALTGFNWLSPRITFSFPPTGTRLLGSLSFPGNDTYWNREFSRAWKEQTRVALDKWAAVTNIEFVEVSDNGDSQYTIGPFQHDVRFGDIRFGSRPMDRYILGTTNSSLNGLPEELTVNTPSATSNGDIKINTEGPGNLLSTLMHEIGHALGLGHTNRVGTIMHPIGSNLTSLSDDDVAGVQSIYGARPGGYVPPAPQPSGQPAVVDLVAARTRYGPYLVWTGINADHYVVQRWHRGQWRQVAVADDGPYFRLPRIVRRTWYRVIGVGFDGTTTDPVRVLVSPSLFLRRFRWA